MKAGTRILLTNNSLSYRTGSELYVRDVALALARLGHQPIAYSTVLGPVAEDLRQAGVPVVDDLRSLNVLPDLIHAQHHLDAMTALIRYPEAPAVYFCHGWLPWQERPVPYPTIARYIAVDDLCRERLLATPGIPAEKIDVVYNFVDLDRFRPRAPLAEKPASALVFSNYVSDGNYLSTIRAACRRMNIEKLDAAGINSGNPVRDPESMLGNYDVVFAKGRCALEAMAVGCAVIVADVPGLGGMVTTRNMKEMRRFNFGYQTMRSTRITEESVIDALRQYDCRDAGLVSDWVRQDAAMPRALERILDVYERALSAPNARARAADPGFLESQLRAGSDYLRSLAVLLKAREAVEIRAARAEEQIAAARREADELRLRAQSRQQRGDYRHFHVFDRAANTSHPEMDDASPALMTRFIEAYLRDRKGLPLEVIDVGSRAMKGRSDCRSIFVDAGWRYRGLDIAAGMNVDIVVDDPYRWNALDDATIDVVVSGHALEHFEFPWVTMREIARILRPGGLACLIVPSAGPEHRHPRDCWRIYSGGIGALAKHAGLRVVEAFTAWGLGEWQNTFSVLQKPSSPKPGTRSAFREVLNQGVGRRFYLESFDTRPQDAHYYLGVARLMLDEGKLTKTLAALNAGLELIPGHPEIQQMLNDVNRIATKSNPGLDRAIAALRARPLAMESVNAAANFCDRANGVERRQLVDSLQGDLSALRQVATVAELAKHFALAALCWEAVIATHRGDIGDLLSWALNSRGAGSEGVARELFQRARDLQLRDGVVNRTTVVQRLIWKLQARRYLEIGVQRGANLLQIEVARKFAVDPDFRIPGGTEDADAVRFFASSSDAFFDAAPPELMELGLDVVLVDGLHTAKQAIRDIENSLRFLHPGGAIVVHHCLPASEAETAASLEQARAMPGFAGVWTGDVFRAIVRLRAREDLFVCVIDADHGIGIVTHGRPESRISLLDSAIDAVRFAELRAAPEALLNLKSASWFEGWLSGITPR